jgi:hypothetical protein
MLGMPGPMMCVGTGWGLAWASLGRQDVRPAEAKGSWDNFSILWASALNIHEFGNQDAADQAAGGDCAPGDLRKFAMLHADCAPCPGWLDILSDEQDAGGYAVVSTAIRIKDFSGITSCGVGSHSNPWAPWRRLTCRELYENLPETFTLEDVLENVPGRWPADPFLLHNNGCWIADLATPAFHELHADGDAACFFKFTKRMYRGAGGMWTIDGESEDWFFSRRLHEAGVKTAITRKVALNHCEGTIRFPNTGPFGSQDHDDFWSPNWRAESKSGANA